MITIEALVKLANHAATAPEVSLSLVRELAQGVLDQLGPSDDCGWPRPMLVGGQVQIPAEWGNASPHPDDASGLGRMLLRYADGAREVAAELAKKAEGNTP